MNHIRSPSELLYGLEYSSGKENGSFPVVFEEIAVFIAIYALAVEVVFVVDKIHLHPGCRNRGNLDDQWPVYVVDYDVHSGQTDHFVKLVLPLVDAAIAWHERADLLLPFLYALWKISSDLRNIRLRKIWKYLRIDEQDPFNRITHNVHFNDKISTKISKFF